MRCTMRCALIVAFIHMAMCGYLRVDIKSFTVEVVTNLAWRRQRAEYIETGGARRTTAQFREEQQATRETTTPADQPNGDCRFKFPEQKHVDGILSDMMNQLTRMYVKTDVFVSKQVSKQTRKMWSTAEVRRALATRFHVTKDRRNAFFDDLFNNMTTEYSKLFNTSVGDGGALRSCPSRGAVLSRWRALLAHSAARLGGAVRACAALYLAERRIAPRSALARRLHRHVRRELRGLEARQRAALCDQHHLCYKDDAANNTTTDDSAD